MDAWDGSCSRRNGGGAHTWEDGLDVCNPAMLALGDAGRVSKELLAERKRCFELLTQNTREGHGEEQLLEGGRGHVCGVVAAYTRCRLKLFTRLARLALTAPPHGPFSINTTLFTLH